MQISGVVSSTFYLVMVLFNLLSGVCYYWHSYNTPNSQLKRKYLLKKILASNCPEIVRQDTPSIQFYSLKVSIIK